MQPGLKAWRLFFIRLNKNIFSGVIFFSCLMASTTAWTQVSVLTQKNDNARTGANLQETTLKTSNVNQATFGKIFARAVDDQIYAQPLYVPNVNVAGKGVHNVVYVTTMNDSVYAFDADDPAQGAALWENHYTNGTSILPVRANQVGQACGTYKDFSGNIGIVGTPAIDLVNNVIYFVVRTVEGGVFKQWFHAVDIRSGAEKANSPVLIQATVNGTGVGSVGGVVTFDSQIHNQRPALALANGLVYVGFASYCDTGNYHGWIMAYDAGTLQQRYVYNDTQDGWAGGIWQAAQAPAIDAAGNLYFLTGNGDFNADIGGNNMGDSFVKLNSTLVRQDWFTPWNQADLNARDNDLGSGGCLLIPGTQMLVGGGKESKIYLLNTGNMGHFNATTDQVLQEFLVNTDTTKTHHIHGSPVYWLGPNGALIYVWTENDFLKAYSFNGTTFNTTPASQSTFTDPLGMPGGMLSLSANGAAAGSGILWANLPLAGDANNAVVPGVLRAFDAANLGTELWNNNQNPGRDGSGNYSKFSCPTVANGKVYLSSFSNQLVVYGLLVSGPTATPTPTPLPQTTWRVNAGGPAYTDTLGHLWSADTNFTGGTAAVTTAGISNTADPTLYQTERYGAFTYTFPVPPGNYQVTLKFAELYWGLAGQRIFNVVINGVTVLTNFDIVADAGAAFKADDKVFNNIAPSGGTITIQFLTGTVDLPKVSAIQIIPQPTGGTATFTPTKTNTPAPGTSTFTPTFTYTPTVTYTPTPTYTSGTGGCGPKLTVQMQYNSGDDPYSYLRFQYKIINNDTTTVDATLITFKLWFNNTIAAPAPTYYGIINGNGSTLQENTTATAMGPCGATPRRAITEVKVSFLAYSGSAMIAPGGDFISDSTAFLQLGSGTGVWTNDYSQIPPSQTTYTSDIHYCVYYNGLLVSGTEACGASCTGGGGNTPTFTYTYTPTFTYTPTATYTSTKTFTPTPTRTFTPPPPPTNTPTFTSTNTATRTFTATLTNTFTPTKTSTPTFTLTNTYTNTPMPPTNTFTFTTTKTNTPTNTPVPTNTPTSTPTNTLVPTNTYTNTFTRTYTSTPSPTSTYTVTNTPVLPTNTFTSTSTNTPIPATNTFTSTSTATSTRTFTNTSTYTTTNTPMAVTNTFTTTRTNTITNTSTRTYTSTNTFTGTVPPTNTATATFTSTSTGMPTFTFTRTNTSTNTYTPTVPPTSTFTSTFTLTATRTFTNTPINTPSATASPTSTSTQTGTNTSTNTPLVATNTPTRTFTQTSTNTYTPTFTYTYTPTYSRTMTPTSTNTLPPGTNTPTPAPTLTFTPTFTNTQTFTSTATLTFSPTPTASATSTDTATATNTSAVVVNTPTVTNTPTDTDTATNTSTDTPTPTNTNIATATSTSTSVPTNTSTSTSTTAPTFTPIFTSTATSTSTATFISTSTNTATSTQTPTSTFTSTAISTPLPVVVLQQSSSSSTANPGQTLGYTLTVTVSGGTANQVTLTDNLPSFTSSVSFTGGPSGTVSGSQITWNLGSLAPGVYTFSFNVLVSNSAPNGTTLSNSALATYLGGPAQSANASNVTVVANTPTATSTSTNTAVPTPTASMTATVSFTPSPTASSTPSAHPTIVVYPNPVTGPGPVRIHVPLTSTADIRVAVFTIAFRKVNSFEVENVQPGVDITLPLMDRWGTPLANGLYYVVVQAQGKPYTTKLMIVR